MIHKKYSFLKFLVLTFFFSLFFCKKNLAQESYSIYQNQEFRPYDRYVYPAKKRFHTSVKPFQISQLDSIVNIDTLFRYKVKRKVWDIVFNRSLIHYKKNDFYFTIDPVMNFEYGIDKGSNFPKKSWINTRGFLIKAKIGKKISVVSSFYENQASFNDYRFYRIEQLKNNVIPGQGKAKIFGDSLVTTKDYALAEAYISYQPNKYFSIQFGHGKNFFGDGYRSLLLSDNSFNYPFLKITTDIWHIKYVNLWAQFQDISKRNLYGQANQKKWGSFHYLDWSVTKWFNLAFFEAVIWSDGDSTKHRGFDINYANPVIFTRPVEFSTGSPDNALMGVNGKVTLFKKHIFYGQFVIDEFLWKEIKNNKGWWANKWAIQAGYKTYDLFDLEHLDIQTEFNYVRPFMYTHLSPSTNYGHYNQGLAHPMGANFWESVSFLKYNFKRFFLQARFSYALHGRDSIGGNFGNDIWKNYSTHTKEYNNYVGQFSPVKLQYINFSLAYLVNPATNLNIYISYTQRREWANDFDKTQSLITFGIRTSLSNFYYDF